MKFLRKSGGTATPEQAETSEFAEPFGYTEENLQVPETVYPESTDEMVPQTKGTFFQRLFHKNANHAPKKKLSKKAVIILVCVIVVAGVAVWKLLPFGKKAAKTNVTYTAATVQKRDVSVTLSGSGTLAAASSYDVTSLVSGEVKSANFEKGDTVQEGDVLYQIDPSDAESSIESAELNVQKSELSYENAEKTLANLNVSAPLAEPLRSSTSRSGTMSRTAAKLVSFETVRSCR